MRTGECSRTPKISRAKRVNTFVSKVRAALAAPSFALAYA